MATRVPDDIAPAFPPAHPWVGRDGRWPRTRHALWIVGRYFRSKDAWIAWPLLILTLGWQFVTVYVALANNAFLKRMFDAIGARAGDQLTGLVLTALGLGVLTAAVGVTGEFFRDSLAIRWRQWLTTDYTGRWLARNRYHDVERSRLIDNPDQRVAEDIALFVNGTLLLATGLVQVPATVVSFSIVLWRLSGTVDLHAIGLPLAVPGGLVWFAIGYALFGSVLLVVFGRPLVRRTMQQQHYEADFRYQLVAIRRNVEQIALARLALGEWARLVTLFRSVRRNFMGLLYVPVAVMFSTQAYLGLTALIPLIVLLPRYFAGRITMGDFMQTQGSFLAVTSSLSWFIQSYPPTIVPTLAALNRLRMLDVAIERPRAPGVTVETGTDPAIRVEGLALRLPAGAPLATIGDWTIAPGSRWIVRGRSGSGKSSLLRAVAGIWPDGAGRIVLPADARLLFVPQQPYLGNGTLRSILSFPLAPDAFPEAACRDALRRAHLDAFADRIDEGAAWSETMSPGEQQRIGFARVLLHRPTHLFLDEATSALDPDTAQAMYALIADPAGPVSRLTPRLTPDLTPDLTIVSVVHTDALDRFHDHILRIDDGRATAEVRPAPPE